MQVTIHGTTNPNSLIPQGETATERIDEVFKFICKNIIEYGNLDKNPRPVWVDVDEKGNISKVSAHTYSINNVSISCDLSKGDFTAISLRPTAVKNSIAELLWIYQQQSNDLVLFDQMINKCTWDEDKKINNRWNQRPIRDADGNFILNEQGHPTIGCCYGGTVRKHNLINNLLNQIQRDPDSRRHIISLWQDDDFTQPHGLKPCVHKSQFMVRHEKDGIDYLDMLVDIRSWDFGTAGSINMTQYLVFLELVARHSNLKPGIIMYCIGNVQIYDRHIDNIKEMLLRDSIKANPKVVFNTTETDFFKIKLEDIKIEGYPMSDIKEKNSQLKFQVAE